MQHDLFNGPFGQVKRPKNTVAILFFHYAFRMSQIKRTGDFFTDGKHLTVGVGHHTKNAQHPSHEPAYRCDDGRK